MVWTKKIVIKSGATINSRKNWEINFCVMVEALSLWGQ